VHDKTVRRRRAVLALLVVLSLILISASFGGSSGGPLRTVQSGFLDVLSPIETGASKALTPVHDLFKWVGDVFHASSQRDQARRQLAAVRAQLAALEAKNAQARAATALSHLDSAASLSGDGAVDATLLAYPPNVWINEVTISVGSGDGVAVDDPVIAPGGLVGIVTTAAASSSVVTLIDDSSVAVAARDGSSRELGVIGPQPGNPGQLLLSVSRPGDVHVGDLIVTAGARLTDHASFFPADIPIGTVTAVPNQTNPLGAITVAPTADLTSLEHLQVLTRVPRA
jgi:rod shape-determining protein MreC